MVTDLVRHEARVWDENLVRSLFLEEFAEDILRMPVPDPALEDRWIWTLEKGGDFSIKPLVRKEQNRLSPEAIGLNGEAWGRLWKLKLQDRLKLTLLKVAAGALKTSGYWLVYYMLKIEMSSFALFADLLLRTQYIC